MSLIVFQVNEIYHDESLGAHINVVLVRIILLSYGKVSGHCGLVASRYDRAPTLCGMNGALQQNRGLIEKPLCRLKSPSLSLATLWFL